MKKTAAKSRVKTGKRSEYRWLHSECAGWILCLLAVRERTAGNLLRVMGGEYKHPAMTIGTLQKSGLIQLKKGKYSLNMDILSARFLRIAMREVDGGNVKGLYDVPKTIAKKYPLVPAKELLNRISINPLFRKLLREYLASVVLDFNVEPGFIHTPAELAGMFEWVLVSRGERLATTNKSAIRPLVSLLRQWRDTRLSVRKLHEDALERAMVDNGILLPLKYL